MLVIDSNKYCRHVILSFISCFSLMPALVNAEINWFSGAALGTKALDFDQNVTYSAAPNTSGSGWQFPAESLTTDYDISINFVNLNISGGFSSGPFYFLLDYDTNISSEKDNYNTLTESTEAGSFGGNVTTSQKNKAEFDRNDYSATLGWNYNKALGVFIGYKYGETEIDYDGIAATGTSTTAASSVNSSFKEDGFFLGASYSIVFEQGALTLSTAWADLSGDFNQTGESLLTQYDGSDGGGAYQINNDSFVYDGDTNGLSFGVAWNGSISDQWSYFLSVKYQQYDFDSVAVIAQTGFFGDANQVTGIVRNTVIESEETVTLLNIGTRYYF